VLDPVTLVAYSSGEYVSDSIRVALLDYYGQTVSVDSSSGVTLDKSENYPEDFDLIGDTQGLLQEGQYEFVADSWGVQLRPSVTVSVQAVIITTARTFRTPSMPFQLRSCVSGEYINTDTCDLCLPGKYTTNGTLYSCLSCLPGSFTNATGFSHCLHCDAGRFAQIPASSSCLPCAK
jgi:hypothetical protein